MSAREHAESMLRKAQEDIEAFQRAREVANRILQENNGDKRRAADRLRKVADDMKKSGYVDPNVEKEMRKVERLWRREASLEDQLRPEQNSPPPMPPSP